MDNKFRVINGGGDIGPKRGDVVACPACGCGLPLVQIGDHLVPCQPVMVVAAEPVRSLVDHRGRPLPIADLGEFVVANAFRAVQVMVPHAAVCDAGARDTHGRPAALHTVLSPPPPDCHACGHAWAAHRQMTAAGVVTCQCRAATEPDDDGSTAQCACTAWAPPPADAEAAGQTGGIA